MDREILFRAVSKLNGNWVYGSLIKYEYERPNVEDLSKPQIQTSYDICRKENDWCFSYKNVPVFEETIGQYTGLTDKNGTKIFEGDIVLSQEFRNKPFSKNYKSKRLIGVVEYYDRKLNDGRQIYESGYRVRFINDNEKSFYNCGAWSDFYDCEVIGNIFDNGELLNED